PRVGRVAEREVVLLRRIERERGAADADRAERLRLDAEVVTELVVGALEDAADDDAGDRGGDVRLVAEAGAGRDHPVVKRTELIVGAGPDAGNDGAGEHMAADRNEPRGGVGIDGAAN